MGRKKHSKKHSNSSIKSRKKIQKTSLTNEELLDTILSKKKKNNTRNNNKRNNNKRNNNKRNNNNKNNNGKNKQSEFEMPLYNEQHVANRLKQVNYLLKRKNISNDELYDLLQERKSLNRELNRIKKEKKEETDLQKTLVNLKVEDVILEVPKKEQELEEIKPITIEDTQVLQLKDISIKRKKMSFCFVLLLLLCLGVIVGSAFYLKTNKKDYKASEEVVLEKALLVEDTKVKEEELQNLYDSCLTKPVSENEKTADILTLEEEVTNYLKKYRASVGYKDLDIGFSFFYNEDQIYYAASTTKILSVLYLYSEASKGNIDLDTTVKYLSRDRWSASPIMSKMKIGSLFSLRDLCKYTSTVSDNTAYQMLVRYIGKNKIRSFGKEMGAKYTLSGGDNFGNINITDALIYMNAINDFINNNGELGQELKTYMVSSDQNGLSLDEYGVQAAHKYGEYSPFYHDYGIVYSRHPYLVAILTREYGKAMINTIKDINSKVYDLHLKYYENRENLCRLEVYGS